MKLGASIGFVIFILTVFSAIAEARIFFSPSTLACPNTRQGEESDCGTLTLQNSNLILGIKVDNVQIGDTTNFTLHAGGCIGESIGAGSSCSMSVTFHPQNLGGYDTNAKATYKYIGFIKRNKISGDISGTSIYPIVRLSTTDVAFGDQTVNTSRRQYVKMENIGNDTLNISSIEVPLDSGFSIEDDCGDSLAVNNYCGILTYFEPTEEREYVTTADITDDTYDSPQQIALSGTGIAAGQADISIEKTYIDFGERALNTETTESVTITSSGTIDLDINLISVSGTAFSQTNDCPATLSSGDTCTITAAFEATVAGAYDGTITIADNATDSPQTIRLSGKGVSPNASLIPGLIDFGNQTIDKSSLAREVILLNSGTSTLTIDDIGLSSSVYSQTNTCDDTLDAKKECSIWITFTPTETGSSPATLAVTSDDPSSPARVFLYGKGITGPDVDISPSLYDFGNVAVGQTSEQQDFIIMNTGEGDLTLSSISVNSDFEQSNECPQILVEEQTCAVETTFVPKTAGNFFGTLSVVDDAEGNPHHAGLFGYGTTSDITLLPATINFGYQTINKSSLAHEVRLLNSGNESITIESIESSSSVFAQTNDCGASLAASAYCTISVIFTPTAVGYVTGQISIADSATGSPHNVDLTGEGIDPVYPDLDIAPNFWDFGQVLVGNTSAEKEFTVKNTGVVDATISSIDVNSEFAQANDCPSTLASDETCTISGTFSPQAAGRFSGNIRIVDDTYSGYQSVLLQGIGSHSGDIDVSFSATALNFENTAVGAKSTPQSVVLTNLGTDDAMIGDVMLNGSEAGEYDLNTNCDNRSLDVGKSCTINITFIPLAPGNKTADVILYDDAHDSPQVIMLSGTANNAPGSCSLMKSDS